MRALSGRPSATSPGDGLELAAGTRSGGLSPSPVGLLGNAPTHGNDPAHAGGITEASQKQLLKALSHPPYTLVLDQCPT